MTLFRLRKRENRQVGRTCGSATHRYVPLSPFFGFRRPKVHALVTDFNRDYYYLNGNCKCLRFDSK